MRDLMDMSYKELLNYALDAAQNLDALKAENSDLKYEVAQWTELAAVGAQNCQYDCEERKKLEELEAENAELKARLEKAVELKYHEGDYVYFISWLSGNICEGTVIGWQEDSGYAIDTEDAMISAYTCFDTREAAEARLKELRGEE